MKKFTAILLALCVLTVLLTSVACTKDNYDDYEDAFDGSLDLETQDGPVTAPPSEDGQEDNAYINAAPANDEQGWGALTPAPGKGK